MIEIDNVFTSLRIQTNGFNFEEKSKNNTLKTNILKAIQINFKARESKEINIRIDIRTLCFINYSFSITLHGSGRINII